ncbi:MAG: hypothetical protein NWQ23_16305 [Yoonia sp.]|uniref:hypothetical protein n=1 Tax=Yoonia sp. TaxID=2212373 RepID=UPI00273D0FD8|nr:hypothetical protein [Yoonia sp.]MDP5086983.1 hypothetical protein [Yoonia sp.]
MAILLWTGSLQADPVAEVMTAAQAAFARMPSVVSVARIEGHCGADATVNSQVVYCTTSNEILIAGAAYDLPQAPYLVAHAYGHAVQVQHGVADFALREIRNRRSEEIMLRGLVERQVDCIAGFLMARAGLPEAALTDWFDVDPFAGAHWGRNPLHAGPQVGIGLDARAEWVARGQTGDLSACAPGEFTAGLLLEAVRP